MYQQKRWRPEGLAAAIDHRTAKSRGSNPKQSGTAGGAIPSAASTRSSIGPQRQSETIPPSCGAYPWPLALRPRSLSPAQFLLGVCVVRFKSLCMAPFHDGSHGALSVGCRGFRSDKHVHNPTVRLSSLSVFCPYTESYWERLRACEAGSRSL